MMSIPWVDGNRFCRAIGWHVIHPFTSEMFELVENRLYAYADDSTLLAVVPLVRNPADRPAVPSSRTRDLARIQEWCNRGA